MGYQGRERSTAAPTRGCGFLSGFNKKSETVAIQSTRKFTLIQNFLITQLSLTKTKTSFIGLPLALVLFNMVACLTGCTTQPTDAQLETLRQEAIAQNKAMMALQEKDPTRQNWQFVVQGQTATGKPVRLSLPQLEALATTSVWTKDPHNNTGDRNALVHFRGVAVSKLLDKFGVAPDATEVTFVASDAYRATVSLADLRQYPIIIALERNNQKIPRSDGGPLYLVFPYSQFPQLQQNYPDQLWTFYITDMVVGTEPIHLKVGEAPKGKLLPNRHSADPVAPPQEPQHPYRVFDAATLAKVPQVTVEENVGYRIGWPAAKVKLYGVRVRDALAAAGLTLPRGSAVIIRGKSPIYRDIANPIRIDASDIKRCDILLATHWGNNRMPIPAKMGGPVTLALSSGCHTQSDNRRWVTFVEEVEVRK